MTLFPFFENIEGRHFLVVGGGSVAAEKVGRLLLFTKDITVVAPQTQIEGVPVRRKAYEESDLDPDSGHARADVVIAATDDPALNRKIALDCRERNIPVNVVDSPSLCSFIFPSLIRRGDLTVAISTAGDSPLYSRMLREEMEALLPAHIEDILQRMRALREILPRRIPQQKARKEAYRRILARLLESDNTASDEEIQEIIREMCP